jgi:hypothetical protein
VEGRLTLAPLEITAGLVAGSASIVSARWRAMRDSPEARRFRQSRDVMA